MSQPPNQPYQGEPHPGQNDPHQPNPAPQYSAPQYPGQPYPGQAEPGAGAGYPPPPPYGGQSAPPPPGFPPPGGDPGFPGAFPPPAKKKSKALKIVLISLAVVLLLCIGGTVAVFYAAKDEVAGVLDATKITVVEPATLGGRPKLTDPQFAGAIAGLKSELAKAPGTSSTVGALYGDPAKKDLVMVAGASAPVLDPAKQLDDTLKGASSGGLTLTDIAPVEPGPLGGTAKCGNGSAAGTPLAVCAWADNGSVGMIAVYFKTVDQIKGEFVALRGEIEQKAK
jgi:hypothetical protein